MRNIHAKLISEYGQESIKILRQWEKLEQKMVDFQNHRRFTLRCLSQDLIPVSIKLKTTVKTLKGIYIVIKAERMLMNERVRLINSMITMFRWQIDTCINSLGSCIGVKAMEECHGFISLRRERRHLSILERQTKKFNLLWQRNTGGKTQTKKKKFQLKTIQTQTTRPKIDYHLRIKEGVWTGSGYTTYLKPH